MSAYGPLDESIVSRFKEKEKLLTLFDSLERGSVFRIKDASMGIENKNNKDGFHFWFILNKDPKSDLTIIMAMGTSKTTPLRHARASNDRKTLNGTIVLKTNEYGGFTKPTVVDCNRCQKIPKSDLQRKYIEQKIEICAPIGPEVIDKLVACYEKGNSSESEILKLLK